MYEKYYDYRIKAIEDEPIHTTMQRIEELIQSITS